MKFETYRGQELYAALVTRKVDGIRAQRLHTGEWVSRSGKPLHNLPPAREGVYEVFTGSFKSTVSDVMTRTGGELVPTECLYQIHPTYDERLKIGYFDAIYHDNVEHLWKKYISPEDEGLVILSEGVYYKVKRTPTYDVVVTGWQEGKGKHAGRMGALLTDNGKIGTGFSDLQRSIFIEPYIVGQTIEVECMELTEGGKFRHPRFIRIREDK